MVARSFLALSASVMAIGLAAPAIAQDAQSEDAAENQEIIVTAQRRSESVQDVPISITALSSDALAKAGIQDTENLSTLTPGLLVQRSVVGQIRIRGIGNENYTIAGDPGVAVHSDGVYVARAAAGLFDLFDVERVEVLRGPQGTLYGRNATGGVINVIPNKPDDEFAGHFSASYGNYDAIRPYGAINVPLSETFALRFAALGNFRDGFTRNTNANAASRGFGRLDSKDVFALRAQAGNTDDSDFKIRLAFEYLKDDSNLPAYKYLNRPTALPTSDFGGGANAFTRPFLRTVNQGFERNLPGTNRSVGSDADVFKTIQTGLSLHMSYDFGGVTLSSISAFRDTKFNWLNDGDGADIFYVNYIQQDATKQYSQELQLSGGGDTLEWMIGGYYFRESGDSFIALPFPFGANLPFYITIDGTAKTKALAAFGELRWKPLDALTVTLGGRYSDEKREAAYRYEINFGAPFVANPDLDDNFNAFTPRLVVNYALSDDLNIYASATRGFKSGGFNLLAIQPGFAPEKLWSYEGGIKASFDGGRGFANANVFYTDYKNVQVQQIVNLQSVLTNAAAATIKGAELEFGYRQATGWEAGGTVAYLDAKYDRFCTGDPTRPTAPISPGCNAANPIDLTGNRFPRAPKWTLSSYIGYNADLGGSGTLGFRLDARYQSLTYFTQFNRPLISQRGYSVYNGRVTWTDESEKYSISLWGNNLTNKKYFTEVLESGAFNPQLVGQGYVAPPRTYGVTASVNF
ncbi:MAG: TonB-dependent receptor [Sphingomonadaceae bacterium]|nr:TonB-dependent receptor [Sphingomonadaceae bacterium]